MTDDRKNLYACGRRIGRAHDRSSPLPAAGAGQRPRPAPTLDRGDTAWMLTSTALVLMMTIPGLALFYGGMVRKMNVLATAMQSFAICCLVTILWMVIGYSLAFTEGNSFFGGFSRVPPGRHGTRRIPSAGADAFRNRSS